MNATTDGAEPSCKVGILEIHKELWIKPADSIKTASPAEHETARQILTLNRLMSIGEITHNIPGIISGHQSEVDRTKKTTTELGQEGRVAFAEKLNPRIIRRRDERLNQSNVRLCLHDRQKPIKAMRVGKDDIRVKNQMIRTISKILGNIVSPCIA